jgi:MFS family permease
MTRVSPPGVDTAPVGGKRLARPGTVAAAFAYRDFRVMWTGQFISGIGTWMQNVALGPYALSLTKNAAHPRGSASFVAVVGLAQLGPLLLFAVVGGVIANRFPRKPLIVGGQLLQMLSAFALAGLSMWSTNKTALLAVVVVGGIANSLVGPTYASVIPELVAREDMPGAISLNSTSLNGSRVIGPLIILALSPLGIRATTHSGLAWIFIINGLTFFASIAAVTIIKVRPVQARTTDDPTGVAQLFEGLTEARRNRVVGRLLLVLFLMSLFCLPYISQFPTIAEHNLGMNSRAGIYTLLFGTWAAGAMLGSLAQATVFSRIDKRVSTRWLLVGFCVALAMFSAVHSAAFAFPVVVILGFFYFGTTTAMSTVLQQHLSDRKRAPVMALWMMSFGGTVAFGGYWGGWVVDRFSPAPMLLIGAAFALGLAVVSNFKTLSEQMKAEEIAEAPVPTHGSPTLRTGQA